MNQPAVHQRTEAIRDAEQIVDYYLTEATVDVTMRWISALEVAFEHIAAHPGSGSPRYGQALQIDGLRSWPVTGFPYLVLYVEGEERVEVLRILHGNRDIPASFQDEEA